MPNYFYLLRNSCVNFMTISNSSTTEARYKKFCRKKKLPEPQQLPPKRNSQLCQLKRVNYVTAAIKKSLISCPAVPSPCEDFGWIIKDGLLQIQWMLRKPVPNT